MGKHKLTREQREAIWLAHGRKCVYCARPIEFRDVVVEHIIPEMMLDHQDQLEELLAECGLEPNFSINDYGNWLPSCQPCNNLKGDRPFDCSAIHYYTQLANAKIEAIRAKLSSKEPRGRSRTRKTALNIADGSNQGGDNAVIATHPDDGSKDFYWGNYTHYTAALEAWLSPQVKGALARTLTPLSIMSWLSMSPTSLPRINEAAATSLPSNSLTGLIQPMLILGSVGSGKSHLLLMVAFDAIQKLKEGQSTRIPVVVSARLWQEGFTSIAGGIRKELASFSDESTDALVERELKSGRFMLLVDGLNEVSKERLAFERELIALARTTTNHIIATSQYEEYFSEVAREWQTYQLDPLTEQQVHDYIENALDTGGHELLSSLDDSLQELVRDPLFLKMTVEFVRSRPGERIPTNITELYGTYTDALLSARPRSKMPSHIVIDAGTKRAVLARYAVAIFKRRADDVILNGIIQNLAGFHEPRDIRNQLLTSGLLSVGTSGPEFAHPSYQLYFYAVELASTTTARLLAVVGEYYLDESFTEVFVFLAGLIRDWDLQASFLDFLEKNDLFLYRRCLERRVRLPQLAGEFWSARQGISYEYLAQLRQTYENLLSSHFSTLKLYLWPWALYEPDEIALTRRLQIAGRLTTDPPNLVYALALAESNAGDSDRNVFTTLEYPVPEKWASAQSVGDFTSGGIDSARDVAFERITQQISGLLKHQALIHNEDAAMMSGYVLNQVYRIMRASAIATDKDPAPLMALSLNMSTADVLKTLEQFDLVRLVRGTSSGHDYGSSKFSFKLVLQFLRRLASEGVELQDFALPIPPTEIGFKGRIRDMMHHEWTDDLLISRVRTILSQLQASYRHLVEAAFYSLRNDFSLYRAGPVRFHATMARHQEGSRYEPFPQQWVSIELWWEPVIGEAESTPVVSMRQDPPEERDRFNTRYAEVQRRLNVLGRNPYGRLAYRESGSVIEYYLQHDVVRNLAYKNLLSDFRHLVLRKPWS